MADFNIATYGENLRAEQSVPICHNVKGSYHYNDQIFYKVTPETNTVISLWKHVWFITNDKIQSKTHYTLVKIYSHAHKGGANLNSNTANVNKSTWVMSNT